MQCLYKIKADIFVCVCLHGSGEKALRENLFFNNLLTIFMERGVGKGENGRENVYISVYPHCQVIAISAMLNEQTNLPWFRSSCSSLPTPVQVFPLPLAFLKWRWQNAPKGKLGGGAVISGEVHRGQNGLSVFRRGADAASQSIGKKCAAEV